MPDGSEVISLPMTRLYVRGDSLIKESYSNNPVARHALSEIQDVSIERRTSYRSIATFIVCGLLALICKAAIRGVWLSWSLTIVFTLVSLFNLFIIKRIELRVKTASGETTYDLTDSEEEIKGFELSLSEMIARKF